MAKASKKPGKAKSDTKKCKACSGTGEWQGGQYPPPMNPTTGKRTCRVCHGAGKVPR